MQRKPPPSVNVNPTQTSTLLFEKKRSLEESKEGLTAQKRLSEQQKAEFEKRKEEIKIQREQLIQKPAMYDHYVKQSYDKIAQAEQQFLSEQSLCRTLEQEIQRKERRIRQLEMEREMKEQQLKEMEEQREYLVKEETDEYPEVSSLIQRYDALQTSTKELVQQIDSLTKRQEEMNTTIIKTRQNLSDVLLSLSNQVDQKEEELKEKRRQMRMMQDNLLTQTSTLTSSSTLHSASTVAVQTLFKKVIVARSKLAGTIAAPTIVQASQPVNAQTIGLATATGDDKGDSMLVPSMYVSVQKSVGDQTSSDWNKFGESNEDLIHQLQRNAFSSQQEKELSTVVNMIIEQNSLEQLGLPPKLLPYKAMLTLIHDFLVDLSQIEPQVDKHLQTINLVKEEKETTGKQTGAVRKVEGQRPLSPHSTRQSITSSRLSPQKPISREQSGKGKTTKPKPKKTFTLEQTMGEEAFWGNADI
ncbi:hypothetical protein BLNAU_721 [Blattamonas nauphoetae]|uniref:Uncharacterized protein n=1 Tax=Blattamonas nauphoetae TaxID=2049346 RepID=A0ABQ9YKK0_9EUKA|nr:hypothetical protein BLNAU_721 [Blattamonas nauphoetae]